MCALCVLLYNYCLCKNSTVDKCVCNSAIAIEVICSAIAIEVICSCAVAIMYCWHGDHGFKSSLRQNFFLLIWALPD